ncbi:hypothetical protein [Pseudoxanthomonas sp. z9]|uniref:hypothetical protein n=1 Tax=Pseudoxanthomonas sp. z9 TaxID=2584942 RepID=UPI0011448A09|nr:hypothetical protein [Pseudoxanthomonas sp. z9]
MAILDGKPFTPVWAQTWWRKRSNLPITWTSATRPPTQPASAVYFGGSLPLPEGIKLEAKEFLDRNVAEVGQQRMLAYQQETTRAGELPLYVPGGYEAALQVGVVP